VRARLTASEAEQLRRLRDAIRCVASHVTDDPRTVAPHGGQVPTIDEALSVINSAAESLPPLLLLLHRIDHTVVADRSATDLRRAVIAGFAVDAVPLLAGDHDRGPLRACLAPACVRYFVQDHTLREWCSPACGNRARVARHYKRAQEAKRRSST
jgi:predicted RNA-binding Zn ribbon-like protein